MLVTSERNKAKKKPRSLNFGRRKRAGKHNFAVLKYEIWDDNHNNKHIKRRQTHTLASHNIPPSDHINTFSSSARRRMRKAIIIKILI